MRDRYSFAAAGYMQGHVQKAFTEILTLIKPSFFLKDHHPEGQVTDTAPWCL
jgi:hypothetical protein